MSGAGGSHAGGSSPVDTVAAIAPGGLELSAPTPKPTAVTAGVFEADLGLWADAAQGLDVGYWECTPGRFTAERNGYTEICQILSGRITVEAEGHDAVELGAGDTLVMPSGWRGTWEVHETVRKLYVIVNDREV